jgi:hypothetical protein
MSETKRAVFLSYASEDADAALRICSALRASGIEVWFDQSELRGGELNRRRLDMALIAVLMPGQRTT